MIVQSSKSDSSVVNILFENIEEMEFIASQFRLLVDKDESYYPQIGENCIFLTDEKSLNLAMHLQTFVNLLPAFTLFYSNYRKQNATFPQLIIHEDYKKFLLQVMKPETINADSSLKDISTFEKKLIDAGMNPDLKLYKHQFDRAISLLFDGRKIDCSIPGAGKTAVIIAVHLLLTEGKIPLLVLCPKNALVSWKKELALWCPEHSVYVVDRTVSSGKRKRKDKQEIIDNLKKKPTFILLNYDKVANIAPVMCSHYLSVQQRVGLALDEAHRLKNPRALKSVAVRSIMPIVHPDLNWAATGTPMPNETADLENIISCLQQGRPFTGDARESFMNLMTWVRPQDLGLPPLNTHIVETALYSKHADLYKGIVRTELKHIQEFGDDIQNIERCIQRVMMYLSYPLNQNLMQAYPHVFVQIQEDGHGAKIDKLLQILEEKIKEGKKVVVWTNWRGTIEYLHGVLAGKGYNPARIDGTVTDDARFHAVEKFEKDNTCMVMLANPMAASEAISLHKSCQCAIFLDVTYNFAHKFQAERRIHRLGLPEDAYVESIFILAILPDEYHCNTLDRVILNRLESKEDNHNLLFETADGVLSAHSLGDTDDDEDAEDNDDVLKGFDNSNVNERELDIKSAKDHMSEVSDLDD